MIGLKTVTGCVKLADLNGDGDSKLCICDFDKKLKVYKGNNQSTKLNILFSSYSVVSLHWESVILAFVLLVCLSQTIAQHDLLGRHWFMCSEIRFYSLPIDENNQKRKTDDVGCEFLFSSPYKFHLHSIYSSISLVISWYPLSCFVFRHMLNWLILSLRNKPDSRVRTAGCSGGHVCGIYWAVIGKYICSFT
jgi:Ciliary BBSome complex subunit 1